MNFNKYKNYGQVHLAEHLQLLCRICDENSSIGDWAQVTEKAKLTLRLCFITFP